MSYLPEFIQKSKTLKSPFRENGEPTLVTSLVSTLLPDIPLDKKTMLAKIGEEFAEKAKRSRGYLSNHFAELSKSGIIKYREDTKNWRQGENYREYMGYIFFKILEMESTAMDSFAYRLMPKKDEQSVDFITSPEEDIFNKPNPYLD